MRAIIAITRFIVAVSTHQPANAQHMTTKYDQKTPPELIFVGDATMSPYEILQAGGSVEYNNEEAGAAWIQRFTSGFPKFIWLNPEPEGVWQYRQSISIMQQLMSNRMFPLTINGLECGVQLLSK